MEEGDAFNIKTVITQNEKRVLSDAICTGSAVVHSLNNRTQHLKESKKAFLQKGNS